VTGETPPRPHEPRRRPQARQQMVCCRECCPTGPDQLPELDGGGRRQRLPRGGQDTTTTAAR
jgi:hypothetical protein